MKKRLLMKRWMLWPGRREDVDVVDVEAKKKRLLMTWWMLWP